MTALQPIEPSTAVAVQTSVRAVGLLRPLADPAAVVQAQNDTRAMVAAALQEGRDYGTIPGVKKPSLLKPGAERLALGFGLSPRFRIVDQEIDHDRKVEYVKRKRVYRNEHPGDKRYDEVEEAGASLGLYRFVVECELIHRDSGAVIAACVGSCSTMESKYVDRPRDVENTILKMAQKRAFVGATLLALGLSDEFTQDAEDLAANGALGDKGGSQSAPASDESGPACPKCAGTMWDNRAKKTNPKAPDYKCKDKACDGVYWPGQWPPKAEEPQPEAASAPITGDTLWPSGQYANTAIQDLPPQMLRWAIQDGRDFGARTAEWQDACRLVLDARSGKVSADHDEEFLPF